MARKVILLGLDGASFKILQGFMNQGKLKNISKLASLGSMAEAIPSVPAFTPTNWATISTGANPGTHGVFTWGTHIEGEPLEENHFDEAMMPRVCKAEYIWETASRFGKKSALINYIGYPMNSNNVYHIDWLYQPDFNYFGVSPPKMYVMTFKSNMKKSHKKNKPEWGMDFLSAEGKEKGAFEELLVSDARSPNIISTSFSIDLWHLNLQVNFNLQGFIHEQPRSVKISTSNLSVELTHPDQWSEWMYIPTKVGIATTRWKLISFDENELRLYRSSIFIDKLFCFPAELGSKLYRNVGPYISDEIGKVYLKGQIDRSTFLDEMRYKLDWIAKCIKFLKSEEGVSLIMLHWHYIDSLQHIVLGAADKAGGDYVLGEKANKAMNMLIEGYELADQLVGEVMKYLNAEDTLIVVSDHGNLPNHHRVSLYNLFQQMGWCRIYIEKGIPKIDMKVSKVYYNLSHVYINLKGRDPSGVVEKVEYLAFRDEVRKAILSIKDPDTGSSPFLQVLTREEAKYIGIWGPGVGDLFLIYNTGYVWSGPEVVLFNEHRVVWPDGGANHGSQPPTGETDFSSNSAVFLISGSLIKKGYKRDRPIRLLDVAPTISKLMEIEEPNQNEGSCIRDVFAGEESYNAHPQGNPLYEVRREMIRPKTYKGDVTDENST